jgi:hypothetical protein
MVEKENIWAVWDIAKIVKLFQGLLSILLGGFMGAIFGVYATVKNANLSIGWYYITIGVIVYIILTYLSEVLIKKIKRKRK